MSRDICTWIRLLGAPSNLALNVSRHGASTTSLGNPFSPLSPDPVWVHRDQSTYKIHRTREKTLSDFDVLSSSWPLNPLPTERRFKPCALFWDKHFGLLSSWDVCDVLSLSLAKTVLFSRKSSWLQVFQKEMKRRRKLAKLFSLLPGKLTLLQ